MAYLDLGSDDPDEFEGKLVDWEGRTYRIGSYLGSGAYKMAYKLLNNRSGLCLHVVKFPKDPESAQSLVSEEVEVGQVLGRGFAQTEFAGVIPDAWQVNGHGGTFEVQAYLGGFEDETSPTFVLWQRGNELLHTSEFAEASAAYEKVLKLNPYHTPALNNLAYAQGHLGQLGRELDLLQTALDIEPNYFPYQQGYLQVLASNGLIRDGLDHFEALCTLFPYHQETYPLAIELYLMVGLPEAAQQLLDSLADPSVDDRVTHPLLQAPEMARLRGEIHAAVDAKHQGRSLTARARGLVQAGNLARTLELLEQAHALYQQDPFTTMNLAFALAREGDFERASELLVSVATLVPIPLRKTCYANTAFNEIRRGDTEVVTPLLDTTYALVAAESESEANIDIWALPGIGVWVDEQEDGEVSVVEDGIDSAAKLVTQFVGQRGRGLPPAVERLGAWYAKAAEVWLKQK